MITYMLRLNLFKQSYVNKNVELATKYYKDACKIYNMDDIYFEYVDFLSSGNALSPNLYLQFNALNNWIKNNASACEKKVLESLLIADLYSLIVEGKFEIPEQNDQPVIPDMPDENKYMYYGYLNMEDVSEYKSMFSSTHDFSLLKSEEVLNGVTNEKIKKDDFKSKQFNIFVPNGPTCFFVLIPDSSTKKVQKFDGIGSFVPFQSTSDDKGFVSNGENTITINDTVYKIYGENSNLEGERTIKIN